MFRTKTYKSSVFTCPGWHYTKSNWHNTMTCSLDWYQYFSLYIHQGLALFSICWYHCSLQVCDPQLIQFSELCHLFRHLGHYLWLYNCISIRRKFHFLSAVDVSVCLDLYILDHSRTLRTFNYLSDKLGFLALKVIRPYSRVMLSPWLCLQPFDPQCPCEIKNLS